MSTPEPTESRRISVSLADLRAELGSLELRLVDRLNVALASKADRSVQENLTLQMADVVVRMTSLEQNSLRRDGPIVKMVSDSAQEINNLKSVAGYRKWLWAQTIALTGIAVPVLFFAVDSLTS